MSELLSTKKNSLYESMSSVYEPTTLENIRNSLIYDPVKSKYTNVTDYSNIITSMPPTKDTTSSQKIVLETTYEDDDNNSPQVIAYIDHPNIYMKTENNNTLNQTKIKNETHEETEEDIQRHKWDGVTTFYVSAVSVVGLYLMFKIIQKSR